MTLKPFGNTSQAKTIKISSPNPTLAKRLGWGMRFGLALLALHVGRLILLVFQPIKINGLLENQH